MNKTIIYKIIQQMIILIVLLSLPLTSFLFHNELSSTLATINLIALLIILFIYSMIAFTYLYGIIRLKSRKLSIIYYPILTFLIALGLFISLRSIVFHNIFIYILIAFSTIVSSIKIYYPLSKDDKRVIRKSIIPIRILRYSLISVIFITILLVSVDSSGFTTTDIYSGGYMACDKYGNIVSQDPDTALSVSNGGMRIGIFKYSIVIDKGNYYMVNRTDKYRFEYDSSKGMIIVFGKSPDLPLEQGGGLATSYFISRHTKLKSY